MTDTSTDEAGMGCSMDIPVYIPTEKVVEILKHKILYPNDYLPVTDITTRVSEDGLGTYREMSLGERRIIENIYYDEVKYEVRFETFPSTPPFLEHVNIITFGSNGERALEFYARNAKTLERVHWHAPKSVALGGIKNVLLKAGAIFE